MTNLTITIPTEDGSLSYHIPKDGGVGVYDAETGDLVIYLSCSPSYIYPLLQVLAARCPDLASDAPDFAKYRETKA